MELLRNNIFKYYKFLFHYKDLISLVLHYNFSQMILTIDLVKKDERNQLFIMEKTFIIFEDIFL